jgi:hypothetical protein
MLMSHNIKIYGLPLAVALVSALLLLVILRLALKLCRGSLRGRHLLLRSISVRARHDLHAGGEGRVGDARLYRMTNLLM